MASLYSWTIIAIVATVMINSETSEGYRILGLFPLNGKSHFTICEQLMKSLAKKGHQVDVVSHFPLKKPFPNYKDFSLHGSLPNVVNNLTFETMANFSSGSFEMFLKTAGTDVCDLFQHPVLNNIIKNPPNDPPYDVVIIETFVAPCYFAFGRHLKVPMIGISTSALYEWVRDPIGTPGNQAIVPGAFTGLPKQMNFWQRLFNTLISHFVKQQFNYYATRQKEYVDKYFGPGYPSIYELSTEVSLMFVNSHFSLDGVQPLTPAVVEIGGLHIEDSGEKLTPDLQKWLDESKQGCIFVSFGSMVRIETFPKETLKVFYDTFKKIAPVRVLMKIAKKEELPPGLPENVEVHPWLPQIQVLKHKNVKTFVTHGGISSTLESIYCGIPLVGIPLFGDQIININSLQKKEMAVVLDYKNITVEEFTSAVNTVMKDPKFRNNMEKISKLYFDRPMSPKDTATFWVEYIIRHGNVLRSPAIDLAWYQVQLLDVYGFILFVILFILYIVSFIIRTLLKCVFRSKTVDNKKILSKKNK